MVWGEFSVFAGEWRILCLLAHQILKKTSHDRRLLKKGTDEKSPDDVGVFMMFSIKKLIWIIKRRGTSWDGRNFRSVILSACDSSHERPYLCSWMCKRLYFFTTNRSAWNDEWPGNSPDLSVFEHADVILKGQLEGLILQELFAVFLTPFGGECLRSAWKYVRRHCTFQDTSTVLFKLNSSCSRGTWRKHNLDFV